MTRTLALMFSLLAFTATSQACTGTINSLSDVASAVKCTTVNLNGFTVPGGSGLSLSLLDGTTVNMSRSLINLLRRLLMITLRR